MNAATSILLVGLFGCGLPAAYLAFDYRRDRKRKQNTLIRALARPADVQDCWVEGPDGDGYTQLFVRAEGARPVDVSTGRDLDALLERLSVAGVACDDRRTTRLLA